MQPRRHSGGAERSDLRTLPPHRTAGNPAPSSRRDLPIPRLRPGRAARQHRPTAPRASSAASTASARPYGKERLRRRNQAQAPACPRRRPQRKVRTRPRNGARTSERVTTPSSARPRGGAVSAQTSVRDGPRRARCACTTDVRSAAGQAPARGAGSTVEIPSTRHRTQQPTRTVGIGASAKKPEHPQGGAAAQKNSMPTPTHSRSRLSVPPRSATLRPSSRIPLSCPMRASGAHQPSWPRGTGQRWPSDRTARLRRHVQRLTTDSRNPSFPACERGPAGPSFPVRRADRPGDACGVSLLSIPLP
jgi:hypothetical protein